MKRLPIGIFMPFLILLSGFISFMTLFNQSVRLDESQSLWMFTKSVPGLLNLTAEDVAAPLYGLLLHFWLQLFGTDIVVARLLSFLFFALTIPVLYQLAKIAANKRVALVTILLFSLSPFIMWYGNETRTYTLFLFVTTLNTLFFYRLFKSDCHSGKMGFFLTSVAGIYTHYIFIFQLATQALFVMLKLSGIVKSIDDFNYSPTISSWQRYKRFGITFFSLLVLALVSLIPWVLYIASLGQIANSLPFIQTPNTFNFFQVFAQFLFGFQSNNLQGILISLWPIIVLMMIISFTQRKQIGVSNIEFFILITFFPIFLIFTVSFVRSLFLARYLIFITPTLFLLLAAVFLSYPKRLSYIVLTLFLISSISLTVNQNVSAVTTVREDYKVATAYLNKSTTANDIVMVSSPFTIYPVEYYYNGPSSITTIPEWNRFAHGPIPPYSQTAFITQLNHDKSIYKYVYLVLSYDQGYQNSIINYMDKHYQLHAKEQFSPGLQVRVYQLRYDSGK
jgi:mannosyltransferase